MRMNSIPFTTTEVMIMDTFAALTKVIYASDVVVKEPWNCCIDSMCVILGVWELWLIMAETKWRCENLICFFKMHYDELYYQPLSYVSW